MAQKPDLCAPLSAVDLTLQPFKFAVRGYRATELFLRGGMGLQVLVCLGSASEQWGTSEGANLCADLVHEPTSLFFSSMIMFCGGLMLT